MICNKTDEKLPTKKNVLVTVDYIHTSNETLDDKRMGCMNKIHDKLDDMFRTSEVRPRGFEWVNRGKILKLN